MRPLAVGITVRLLCLSREVREREVFMRVIFGVVFAFIIAAGGASNLKADPYRWCAEYGGGEGGGGGSNCYFVTLDQCRAAISGNGGFCRENGFYDGRPVTAPGSAIPRSRKRDVR